MTEFEAAWTKVLYNDDHAALQYAVAFVPAAPFCANNADARTLRLSFVTPSVEEIHRGVAALATAYQTYAVEMRC